MPARKPRAPRPSPTTARAPAPPPPVAVKTPWRTAVLLFVALLGVYASNLRVLGAGDSLPTRLLPFSLLREHNLDLDEFDWELRKDGRPQYFLHPFGGHLYSASPIATPFVVLPLYVLPAWWLSAHDVPYDDVRARVVIVVMERLSAAVMTALSVSLLFVILSRMVTPGWALGLALTQALGTTTWVVSSQALWPHTLAQLALVMMTTILLAERPTRTALMAAGIVAAVAVANRPPMVGFALLALVFVWRYHRRDVLAFAALPAAIGAALLAYNLGTFRALAGGYGSGLTHFSNPLIPGLLGLLVSPNRGLFVFTPIMLFAGWGAVQVWRVEVRPWLRFLVIGLGVHLAIYAKFDEWWAGYTYGPRYLTDVLPILTLLLVYGLVPLCRGRAMRALAAVLVLYGVGVQALGVYCAEDEWNREPLPLELSPQRVWDWSDLQIARALHSDFRGGEMGPLLLDVFRDAVPARLQPLAPEELASAIRIANAPTRMRAAAPGEILVRVSNRGAKAWPAFSGDGHISVRYLTLLVVRWFAGGQPVAGAGDVLRMPSNLMPGESLEMAVPLVAPARAGTYQVELRVTQALDGRHGISSADAARFPVTVE